MMADLLLITLFCLNFILICCIFDKLNSLQKKVQLNDEDLKTVAQKIKKSLEKLESETR